MSGQRGRAVASAAEALVGTRFRLHGRDPEWGLDCVGLVAVALERAGYGANPLQRYGLRNSDDRDAARLARGSGLLPGAGPHRPGDVLLVHAGPGQSHLVVISRGPGFVHAHAGLRRVVAEAGPPPWPVIHLWRPNEKG